MTAFELDHITITAPDLVQGADYVEELLGVRPPAGGQHLQMGTHNLLMALGPDLFLEVVAVDPSLERPARPRWFDLDNAPTRPLLKTWVMRCPDIESATQKLFPKAGRPTRITRGNLNWLISIADDGTMPMDGTYPILIEWPEGPHPAAAMPDLGCRLSHFTIRHPEVAHLRQPLDEHLSDDRITLETAAQPQLEAVIETPNGPRRLT